MNREVKGTRAAALMQQVRVLGEKRFEPRENLLRVDDNPSGRNGYVVGQQSLEYSIALLETGSAHKDYIGRANAIINRVLEFQIRDPQHHRCGNFIWMAHWDEPRDPNAVAFLTPNLVYLYRHHAASLWPETRANMEAAFPLCAQALLQREVPYEYTNIKVLTTLAQFVLAPLVPESSLESAARFHWQHWVTFTAQYGIPEYNSPTYLPVILHALEELWQFGPIDLHADFERMLEYFYFEFAARYHAPSGYLAGAMSRAYPQDLQTGQGMAALVAHLQWGVPYELAGMNDVRWLRSDYLAPEEVRRIAFEKPMPLQIRADTHHPQSIFRTDYFTAEYSLGSQNGYSGNQEVPLFISACGDGRQRSSYLQASARDSARLVSEQDGSCVVGYYYCDPHQVRDNALIRAQQPDQELILRWHLGHRAMVKELWLNGQTCGAEYSGIKREGTIAMRFGQAILGLRFAADEKIESFSKLAPVQLKWEDEELILSVCICPTAAQYVEHGAPLGLSFYLKLAPATNDGLEQMQQILDATQLNYPQSVPAEATKSLQVDCASEQLTATVPAPKYLHHSALAQFKPNDLLLWLQGKNEAGRELLFGKV